MAEFIVSCLIRWKAPGPYKSCHLAYASQGGIHDGSQCQEELLPEESVLENQQGIVFRVGLRRCDFLEILISSTFSGMLPL